MKFLVCIGIGYMMIKRRRKMSGQKSFATQIQHVNNNPINNKNLQIFTINKPDNAVWLGQGKKKRLLLLSIILLILSAVEWMHEKYSRSVTVILDRKPAIQLAKRRGGLLRSVSLENIHTLQVTVSDTGFVLVDIPNDYDLVQK